MSGLKFLQALAQQRQSGSFLEIGPLFGSSTRAIAAGRVDSTVPIHTIDTFEAAAWVRKRLGVDLSLEAFRKHTSDLENLHVYKGFAPDVVKRSWTDKIGFYFDDATHGDPGWSANYAFFSPFFTDDAIICGDDFACGWPDVVRNVYKIASDYAVNLFVIGRVWAFTLGDDIRLTAAAHSAFPKLRGFDLTVSHDTETHRNIAASWSWGLHRDKPLTQFHLHAPNGFQTRIRIARVDGTESASILGREPVALDGATEINLDLPPQFGAQFCVLEPDGKTHNTRELRSLRLDDGQRISAIRLTHG